LERRGGGLQGTGPWFALGRARASFALILGVHILIISSITIPRFVTANTFTQPAGIDDKVPSRLGRRVPK
jgi:hypothetical protein